MAHQRQEMSMWRAGRRAVVRLASPAAMALVLCWALPALVVVGAVPAVGQERGAVGGQKAQQAAASFAQGQMDDALRLYDAALEDSGLSSERRAAILTDRGVVRERLGDVAGAIEDFNKAVGLFPEYAAVYNNRGAALLKAGVLEEAIRDFERAILLAPGYVAAHVNRAGALMRMQRYGDAAESYGRAVKLAPTMVEPLTGRAGAFLASGRHYAALRDLGRAVANDQRFPLGYRLRAEAYMAQNRFEQAAADLSRAIAFEPANADNYVRRGEAHLRNKDPAAAAQDFAKAIELQPQRADAVRERGHASILVEEFEQAEQDLARAIQLSPREALTFAYRALLYKKLGQPELGEQEIRKAMLLDKNDARVLWAKGEIDEALSRPQEALEAYRSALAIDPELQNAIFGLRRLGEEPQTHIEPVLDRGMGDWQVFVEHGKYWARKADYADLRVPLEMEGAGQPRLLGWELRPEEDLEHIGLLRYSAGQPANAAAGATQNEYVAVIDTRSEALLGIEPHKSGTQETQWTFADGRITAAGHDGVTQQYVIREVRQPVAAVPSRRRDRETYSSGGVPYWAPWAETSRPVRRTESRRRRSKPKTLFDLLLGN